MIDAVASANPNTIVVLHPVRRLQPLRLLVDFVGAAEVSRSRYATEDVMRTVLPFLRKVKARGLRPWSTARPRGWAATRSC